jgi:thioredoxin-like negative regulator of GroEL
MGFFKRLIGIETKPGEPVALPDEMFDEAVREPDMPVFVFFFSNWCSTCQVMHGLINEVGPEYIGRARFYKMDATKNPHAVTALEIRSVPVLAAFTPGGAVDRATGLLNITELRNWIESHLPAVETAPGQDISETGEDRG